MKTLLAAILFASLAVAFRAGRTAARAEASWPGRFLPAWVLLIGLVLRPVARRAGCDRKAAEWILSLGLDVVGLLLPAFQVKPVASKPARRRARRDRDRRYRARKSRCAAVAAEMASTRTERRVVQ